AWMPRKSLHGRTCGVSREGGRARALQPSHKPAALQQTGWPPSRCSAARQANQRCVNGRQ
ncbi:hypothetical protein XarzCFBP7410_04835, partial [Xanthomonas arboricola pv. zantedeschiae]